MKDSRMKFFLVDFLMSFVVVFGVVMFLPMLPSIQVIFGASVSQISWIPNIGYITMILFAVIGGNIINKAGLKSLLLISLLLWIIGISIEILSFNKTYYVFIFGRFIEGIGEAIIFPILLYMNKVVFKGKKDEKFGSSLIEFGAALGGLISAVIAGKFVSSPQQFLFIPLTIAVLTGIFIFTNIKEVPLVQDEVAAEGMEMSESRKAFVSLLLLIFMTQTIFSSIQVYLAYYMNVYSAANFTGVLLSIEQIFAALGTIAPIYLLKHISFNKIRNIIILVFIGGVCLLGVHLSIYITIASAAAISFFVGVGFTTLNIYLSKIIHTKVSQKVSIYTSIRYSGGFILSLCWGKFIETHRELGQNYGEIFKHLYIAAGIMAVVLFLVIALLQKNESHLWETEPSEKVLMESI
jgi:MFS family permease